LGPVCPWLLGARRGKVRDERDRPRAGLAAVELLVKFRRLTDCGGRRAPNYHFEECYDLCEAFGWDSFDDWVGVVVTQRTRAQELAEVPVDYDRF
jgi:hypothetical protein